MHFTYVEFPLKGQCLGIDILLVNSFPCEIDVVLLEDNIKNHFQDFTKEAVSATIEGTTTSINFALRYIYGQFF